MKKTSAVQLSKKLKIHPVRGLEAVLKAKLVVAILEAIQEQKLTHAELSERTGIPRSAVTGILNGSLQKVTLDRLLRLADGARLEAEIRFKKSSKRASSRSAARIGTS